MPNDEFLKPFKYSKPLAGGRPVGKIPTHTPKLAGGRPVGKIPTHTPKLAGGRPESSKLSNYKPYKKESK